MKQLATLAAFAIIGALLGSQSQESTPPPAESTPRREVIQPQAEDAPSTATPALEEPRMWYSSYDAAGKVALETGRDLIVSIRDAKPDYEPTSDIAFCWLHIAEAGPEWDKFNPPCDLRCDRVTDTEPPIFYEIDLEAL